MTPELRRQTGVADDEFKVLEAWSQAVSGKNDFYWIQGKDQSIYSVNFYTPMGITILRPTITYFAKGELLPTAGVTRAKIEWTQLGGFEIHEIRQKDLELIRFITPQLREEFG